jgi:hypothetical protein
MEFRGPITQKPAWKGSFLGVKGAAQDSEKKVTHSWAVWATWHGGRDAWGHMWLMGGSIFGEAGKWCRFNVWKSECGMMIITPRYRVNESSRYCQVYTHNHR